MLKEAKNIVESIPELKKYIEVVEVTEQGKDWIVREFDKTSVPLKNAFSTPSIAQIRKSAMDILANQQGAIEKNILKKLNKNSANLHWSKVKNKIIIIDMQ